MTTFKEAHGRLTDTATQERVADALEVSPRQVRRYLSGEADAPEVWPDAVRELAQQRIRKLKGLVSDLRGVG